MLGSHSRLHGSTVYRVPWLFDDEACDVVKFFTNLKCSLMPYIFQKSVEAHEEGTPVMRPMVFEFMNDPAVPYLDQQYMLGDALLVAPVFREDKVAQYYLPEGTWTELLTGETKEGGRWFQGTYDYFSMPLYVRENSIVVRGNCDTRPDYDYADHATVCVYQLKDAAETKVPDIHGNNVFTVKAVKDGDTVKVFVEGAHTELKVEVFVGNEKKEAVLAADANEVVVA